jgi:16S rRNA (guanine527-N7)-methyltransferase
MKNLFLEYGINLTDKQLNSFENYYSILIEFNKMFNLTAITEKQEVYKKHFVDSVINVDKLVGEKLIDVGSGGGFPAIPIKILREDINVTLLEATGKKCEFLKEVIKRLDLKDIQVINGRAEDLAKDLNYRESFDICTARAVARLNTLCEYCMPFVKVGGQFVSFKGNVEEELTEGQSAIKILGGQVKEVYSYQLDGANRALVYIDKIKPTDKKYPRGNGKERKSPL